MDNGQNTNQEPTNGPDPRQEAITGAIREAAYAIWSASREPDAPSPKALFDAAYLGHYASIDAYVDELVDRYELDAKLDVAIGQPFRSHVDIDITGLARALVANGTLYAIPAMPIGVWVFNGEIE